VTLIPGDGIGVELTNSVKTIFKAANAPIEWDQYNFSGINPDGVVLNEAIESLRRNKVGLKGI
jgi:isocitrate dehydrogenase (NAD+)